MRQRCIIFRSETTSTKILWLALTNSNETCLTSLYQKNEYLSIANICSLIVLLSLSSACGKAAPLQCCTCLWFCIKSTLPHSLPTFDLFLFYFDCQSFIVITFLSTFWLFPVPVGSYKLNTLHCTD